MALVLAVVSLVVPALPSQAAAAATGTVSTPAAVSTPSGATSQGVGPGPWYTVALGASLAAGSGASSSANAYVNVLAAAESTRFPGLSVDNVSCGGDTLKNVLYGDHCRPAGRTQLGDAVSFLQGHVGHIAYITMDIGADEILGCIQSGNVSVPCVVNSLAEVRQNLPLVVNALKAAAPGVPLVGAVYYNPELYPWIEGPAGQVQARTNASLLPALNGTIEKVYAQAGVPVADWQGAFATQDFVQEAPWDGQMVPLSVARTCSWTHECDAGHVGQNLHTNDAGHAVLAASFQQVLTRIWRAGGNTGGEWLAASDGGVFALGGAPFYGSMGGKALSAPVVGIAAVPGGGGYWEVASDGGVFAFGDAAFYGSMGGKPLSAPVVAIVPSPSGFGYWEVAQDGGVFTFGDAAFFGSMGGTPLAAPIATATASPDGNGYLLVARDGGVFAFGDAFYGGSTASLSLAAPIVGMTPTLSGGGYHLVAADGGDFAFGDARFNGSLGGKALAAPVVGVASPG